MTEHTRYDGLLSVMEDAWADSAGAIDAYRQSVDGLYETDSLAAEIVDALVDDATGKGWSVRLQDVDETDALDEPLEDLCVRQKIAHAAKQARLYGGAAIVLVTDDPAPLDEPLDPSRVRALTDLRVLDLSEIRPSAWEADWLSPRFGAPSEYNLTPLSRGAVAPSLRVHASRVIPCFGDRLSRAREDRLDGWGLSVLARPARKLARFEALEEQIGDIVARYRYGVLHLAGLAGMVGSENGEAMLVKRLRAMSLGQRRGGVTVLDGDDKWTDVSATVTGLSDLWDRGAASVASAARMPMTRLFGLAPGGLASTDDSGLQWWRDRVSDYQQQELRPAIDRIVEVYAASRDGVLGGAAPESWTVEFHPLDEPTTDEAASARLKNAQADAIYLDRGVVSPSRVAQDRFGGDSGDDLAMTDGEIEAVEAQAVAAAQAPQGAPVDAGAPA